MNELAWEALDEVTLEGYSYAVASKRGKHQQLEDTYQALTGVHGDPSQAIFGIFDGHGGRQAAEHAAEHIHQNILSTAESGAAAITALIRHGTLWIANAGDCRAVMSRDGAAVPLSEDHRPDRASERYRIESQGGAVVCWLGTWRVQGVLGLSRAIGDREMKTYITAEPEVSRVSLAPGCEFLVLGSDGIWDFVNNQEAVDLIHQYVTNPPPTNEEPEGSEEAPSSDSNGSQPLCDSPESTSSKMRISTIEKEVSSEGLPTTSEKKPDAGVYDVKEDEDECFEDDGLYSEPQDLEDEHKYGFDGGEGRVKGADAACRALIELAQSRGSRDDVSALVVDLRPYFSAAAAAVGTMSSDLHRPESIGADMDVCFETGKEL
eukprot:gene16432-19507_t